MTPDLPQALQVALRVIDALESLGVRYHIGGSYASSIHGIPRQTQDIDLVAALSPDSAAALARQLSGQFYADESSARAAACAKKSFNLVHLDSGIKVDVFALGDAPFDREEFGNAEPVQVDPQHRAFVKSPEDTILRKLLWYRLGGEVSERQWSDIVGISRIQGDRLDLEHLHRWALELGVADLLDEVLRPRP